MWLLVLISAATISVANGDLDLFERLNEIASKKHKGVSECEMYLASMFDDKGKWKEWALMMLDSTSKLQAGIFSGNLQELGAFDECIGIEEVDLVGSVKGKYCLGNLQISKFPQFQSTYLPIRRLAPNTSDARITIPPTRWSICVPDVCSASQLNSLLFEVGFPATFEESFCQTASTQSQLTLYDNYAIIFFCFLGAVMLASTLYDYIATPKGQPHSLLVAFSMLTNGRKLFQVRHDPKRLSCVEGLKVISIMWIAYGHIFERGTSRPYVNKVDVVKLTTYNLSMYIFGANLAVDTFFVIGGMVLVYTFLSMKLTRSCFNVPSFYIHRYIRLTPVLAAVLLVHVTLLDNMISGPFKPSSSVSIAWCHEYWWTTLLYVQNYVNVDKPCLGVSWYLMIDFQLVILSPILLIPLRRHPKLTLSLAGLLACISVAVSFYLAWEHEINFLSLTVVNSYSRTFYSSVYTRASTWLIGFILGYYVYQAKNVHVNFKINKALVFWMWVCTLFVMTTCVFCGHHLTDPKSSLFATSSYNAFVRPSWAILLSWVVFACTTGYGGPINSFLSISLFQILGRLTYCIYLTHVSIMSIISYSERTPTYFSTFNAMLEFWQIFMLSIGVSVLWTLAFESPVIAIEKYFRGSSKLRVKEHAKGIPGEA